MKQHAAVIVSVVVLAGAPLQGQQAGGSAASAASEQNSIVVTRSGALRRGSQAFFLGLFLLGPLAGLWIVKGNLNYSYTLGILPLTDPYMLLQSALAGHAPESIALIGVAIVLAGYLLVGGRVYCSWVCPVNM